MRLSKCSVHLRLFIFILVGISLCAETGAWAGPGYPRRGTHTKTLAARKANREATLAAIDDLRFTAKRASDLVQNGNNPATLDLVIRDLNARHLELTGRELPKGAPVTQIIRDARIAAEIEGRGLRMYQRSLGAFTGIFILATTLPALHFRAPSEEAAAKPARSGQ